ncbi:MAG: peptidoglycan-binding protein [Clostridia bacterium]|nr:peptidoglycan-binding protein [Clostridia bacterium]
MKKIGLLILMLALLLTATPALAAATAGQGDMVARNGELAAFMDGNGNIYVSGLAKPVNTTPAENILSIDPYRIVFFAEEENALIALDLDSFSESVICIGAKAACVEGDDVYYIDSIETNALKHADLSTDAPHTTLFRAPEELERIYVSDAGVVATLVDGAGAYIQDAITGNFVPFNGDVASEIASFDGFEIYLTDTRNLYIQEDGLAAATLVDSTVQDWAVIGETIYYLSGSASNLTLKSYDVANGLWNIILRPSADMEVQLTASENALFMLSKGGTIYSVDVRGGMLVGFATLPALTSYALGNGKTLDSYRIEAVSGQLNVYGIVNDADTLPTFTFVDFSSQIVEDSSSELMLLSAYAIQGESTVWDLLQPAEQYSTLRKGSRGEAVSAIQEPLSELNYYDYYIDGIFGWRTERAIRLLQADLGLTINGIADGDLQRAILSGKLEAYDPYKVLDRGDRGYRVQEMQERLRDLGYLADDADAIFGPRTQTAVETFQEENGLSVTGEADSKTLQKLYSDSANACSSYIELRRGDTGYRVRELNRRLKALYYLEGEAGSSYNSATYYAVLRFQQEYGLTQTGVATTKVQQRLFSKNAPEYSGYITLQRGDDNDRVEEMQDRLADLGYHAGRTDGYFDKVTRDSVKKFQRAIGVKVTGIADPETLEALFSKNAPEYREPEKISPPIIELSAYSKFEDSIFFIADSATTDGGVTVSWYADGDVASYDVRITDDRGNVYLDETNRTPDQTIASIPVTSLDAERTYSITVTAYPIDIEGDDPAQASIRFVRVLEEPEPDEDEIGMIGKLIITPVGDNISRENGVYQIPGEVLSFIWSADGSVAGYDFVLTDADDNVFISNSGISERQEAHLNAGELDPSRTYVLTVYAIPTNGGYEDATTGSISFQLKAVEPEVTPEPTQEPVIPDSPDGTPEEPDTSEEPVITPEPTVEPTIEPIVTPEPTEEPAVTEEPTVEPELPEVGVPQLSVAPYAAVRETTVDMGDGVTADVLLYEIYEGDMMLSWTADNADVYDVVILDAANETVVAQTMEADHAGINSSVMRPGEVYTLQVTAFSSQNAVSAETAILCFMLPAEEEAIEPVTEEEPAEENVYAEEYVETPVEEEIYEEEYVEEPVQEEVYEEEYVEEPVEEEVYEEEYVEEPVEEEVYEEEYVEEPVQEEVYEEEPVEEGYYPTDDPSAWDSVIGMDSDPEAIKVIQERLVEWMWLFEGDFEEGVLDDATAEAIAAFQGVCAEYGLNLEPIDLDSPMIETDTLWLLFNADGMEIVNPYV